MICRLNVSYNYLKTHFSDFHTFFWNKDFAMLNLLTTINVTNHNETTLSHLNFLIYTLTYTPASKLQANTRSLMSHSLTWNFHKFDSHCSHLWHHLATSSIWLFDSTFFLESGWWFFSQFLSTSQNTSNATKKNYLQNPQRRKRTRAISHFLDQYTRADLPPWCYDIGNFFFCIFLKFLVMNCRH